MGAVEELRRRHRCPDCASSVSVADRNNGTYVVSVEHSPTCHHIEPAPVPDRAVDVALGRAWLAAYRRRDPQQMGRLLALHSAEELLFAASDAWQEEQA
jgi:hypothetical protein